MINIQLPNSKVTKIWHRNQKRKYFRVDFFINFGGLKINSILAERELY
jgi:hypothetical protein